MSTIAARAGFLAGFAYYELSRQSVDSTDRVPEYTALLLGVFTIAIVVVVRNAVTQRMFRKVFKDVLPNCVKDFHDSDWAFPDGDYRWNTYRLFYFAWLLYIVAMSFMVDVYNPDMKDHSPIMYYATRYVFY